MAMATSRDVRFVRDSITDAFRIAGGTYLYRRKLSLKDDSEIGHCEHCYDPVLKQVMNSRCPYCFGTGLADGGFGPVGVVRAHLTENTRDYQSKPENPGIREMQDMTMKLPYHPLFRSGDVFAEILEIVDGRPYQIGRVMQITGDVTWKTLQGTVSNDQIDLTMALEDRIVSQEANVKLLLDTDDKYLRSDEFWGITLDQRRNPLPETQSGWQPQFAGSMTDAQRYHTSVWEV